MENNKDDLLGKKLNATPKPEQNIGIDTNEQLLQIICGAIKSSQLDTSQLNNFLQVAQRRDKIYELLDMMCEDSTNAAVLETYSEDATEYNEQGRVVWVESDDPEAVQYINFILKSINVDKNAYKWVSSLCKYGDLYLRLCRESEYVEPDIFFEDKNKKPLNEAIKVNAYDKNDRFTNYVEMVANPAELFELTKHGKTMGYLKADVRYSSSMNKDQFDPVYTYSFKKGDVNIYDATTFVHATLDDNISRTPEEVRLFIDKETDVNAQTYTVKRGQSIFYNMFKIWRELSLLENSLILNRITKSAKLRIMQIEVGDMDKTMVQPYLQSIKSVVEQKAALNAGNSMTEYTNPGPMENTIYVPKHGEQGAITTEEVGGDVNVGSTLPDIEYFNNKYFAGTRIPKQYLANTEDGAGFNGGQSLSIISSRYAKRVKWIQNSFIQMLTDLVNIFLIDRKLTKYLGNFTLKMQIPVTQEEIDRRENLLGKVQMVSDIMNLLQDVEEPSKRLEITKILLSNIVTDEQILGILQEEIDKLKEQGLEEIKEDNVPESEPLDNEPLDLDKELNIKPPTEGIEEESDETLPSPEELDIGDLTNNENEEIQ